jgi:hypothetical protein
MNPIMTVVSVPKKVVAHVYEPPRPLRVCRWYAYQRLHRAQLRRHRRGARLHRAEGPDQRVLRRC